MKEPLYRVEANGVITAEQRSAAWSDARSAAESAARAAWSDARSAAESAQAEILKKYLTLEETKMPYRITKEGNVSHTALPALERIKRVTLILAVLTAVVLILTW